MKKTAIILLIMTNLTAIAQNTMSPETLWKLGRVSTLGISKDEKNIIYKVDYPSVEENKSNSKLYSLPINGGTPTELAETKDLLKDKNISPDGKYVVYNEEVKIDKVHGKDFYPELDKSNAQIYNGLDYRHWDKWNEGKFNHVFYKENKEAAAGIDILKDETFDSPQKPFGGDEDYIWSAGQQKHFIRLQEKIGNCLCHQHQYGHLRIQSGNRKTINRTEGNLGYGTASRFFANRKFDLVANETRRI